MALDARNLAVLVLPRTKSARCPGLLNGTCLQKEATGRVAQSLKRGR